MYLQSIWIFWKSRLTGGLRQCGICPLTYKKMRPLHTAWQCIKSASEISISFLYWNVSSAYMPTCPDGGCGLFLTVYYQDNSGLSDRLKSLQETSSEAQVKLQRIKIPPIQTRNQGAWRIGPAKTSFFYWRGYLLSSYYCEPPGHL